MTIAARQREDRYLRYGSPALKALMYRCEALSLRYCCSDAGPDLENLSLHKPDLCRCCCLVMHWKVCRRIWFLSTARYIIHPYLYFVCNGLAMILLSLSK